MQDPQQFLETLKTELFEDEVYVFTPKGAIKVLPRGATPIDFAYNIHAEIGNKMVGAKINSKMVPIITPIKNGDIVEILTSDNSKGPSMDWLKFVKSTSAKSKINSWFKKEKREENIEKGKDLIEKELKRIGIPYAELFKTDYINPMLERYKYKNLDEMYLAVGFGAITANRIIARMLIEYRKEHKEEPKIEEKIDFFVRTALPPVEGIFFEGQIFDAYVFASNLIKSAQKTIVLIDNYIDENTLMILSKRNEKVEATVYTAKLTKQLQLDLQRHNAEYPAIAIHEYKQSHDRFLIIDSEVFHIGASLKDLGKKWFAFSKLHFSPQELIERMLTEIQK